jgi:hypothetical protein
MQKVVGSSPIIRSLSRLNPLESADPWVALCVDARMNHRLNPARQGLTDSGGRAYQAPFRDPPSLGGLPLAVPVVVRRRTQAQDPVAANNIR